MKIVCISDTHGKHKRVSVPPGDVLVVAGDFTNIGNLEEVEVFNHWLSKLPHKYKICIAGNHDICFQKTPDEARKLLTNCIYLEDSWVMINGIRFYGAPWQPEFMRWAFNLPRSGKELKDKWAAIPDNTDVLITHCPPMTIFDCVNETNYQLGKPDLGCRHLLRRVLEVQPQLHVFGHIHDSYGSQKLGNTMFANVSLLDESYVLTNAPKTFEVKRRDY